MINYFCATPPYQKIFSFCDDVVPYRHIIKHNIAESCQAFPLLHFITKNLVQNVILKLNLLKLVYILRINIKMTLEEIKKLLYVLKENDNPFVKFFTQTSLHLQLLSIIYLNHVQGTKDNFEKILTKINKRLGSRSTLLKCLKDGVELGFIKREESTTDRRIVHYSLFEERLKELDDYWREANEELLQQERKLR